MIIFVVLKNENYKDYTTYKRESGETFVDKIGEKSTGADLFRTTSIILTSLPSGGSNLEMMSESHDVCMSLSLRGISVLVGKSDRGTPDESRVG